MWTQPTVFLICVAGFLAVGATDTRAQVFTGSDAQRRCHTLLTCNFKRGGAYRGCLSSYSCRSCRVVRARCRIAGKRGHCRRLRCGWEGS